MLSHGSDSFNTTFRNGQETTLVNLKHLDLMWNTVCSPSSPILQTLRFFFSKVRDLALPVLGCTGPVWPKVYALYTLVSHRRKWNSFNSTVQRCKCAQVVRTDTLNKKRTVFSVLLHVIYLQLVGYFQFYRTGELTNCYLPGLQKILLASEKHESFGVYFS